VALLVVTAVASPLASATAAHAQATDTSALRAEADALANRYFDTLTRVQALDDELARDQQQVDDMTARARQARESARARALIAYTSAGTHFATLVDGADTLDTARRAHLIDRVNARDQEVFDELTRATRALSKQQRELAATRSAQADAMTQLKAQGAAVDAKLAAAEAASRQAAATAAATTSTAPAATAATTGAAAASAATPTTATAPPAAPAPAPGPPAPAAPAAPAPGYSGTPGVSPHHDDPFLTCVRARESGGNYGVVNPAGPYLGAYQFLQSTWNVTAAHAGRGDLVGVAANVASPYDQDEMAWALYQWQGTRPWGGGC
jgi:hypothetical protein